MPYAAEMTGHHFRRIATETELTDFGVRHVVLKPRELSSHRHWNEGEDEFVAILEGEAVLIENEGEPVMRAGDCAAFPKGHSQWRSSGEPERRGLRLHRHLKAG